MPVNRFPRIGIIAEDISDVDSVKVLIGRIINNENISVKPAIGHGCGKIVKKCRAWAEELQIKGCSILIVIQDCDNNNVDELRNKLSRALSPSPIRKHIICIPVQELESWFMCDPDAIKAAMGLSRRPKISGRPEDIDSPKEKMGNIIYTLSNKRIIYINTTHNKKIASYLSIEIAKVKCPSFSVLYEFVNRIAEGC